MSDFEKLKAAITKRDVATVADFAKREAYGYEPQSFTAVLLLGCAAMLKESQA